MMKVAKSRARTEKDDEIETIRCSCPEGAAAVIITDADGAEWAACAWKTITGEGEDAKESVSLEVHGSHGHPPGHEKYLAEVRALVEARDAQVAADAAEKAKHIKALRSGKPGAATFAWMADRLEKQG